MKAYFALLRIGLELYSTSKIKTPIKFNYDNFIQNLPSSYKQFINEENSMTNNHKISKNEIDRISRIRGGEKFRELPKNLKIKKLLPQKNLRTAVALLTATSLCVVGASLIAKDSRYGLGNLKDLKKFSTEDVAKFNKILKDFCEAYNQNILEIFFNNHIWQTFRDYIYWNSDITPVTRLQYIVLTLEILQVPKSIIALLITTSIMAFLASPFVVAAFGYSLIQFAPVVVAIIMAFGGLGGILFDLLQNKGQLFATDIE